MKSIDPSRGDRLDDRPEIEEMYQASVGLQGQINALIKKYSDQKGGFWRGINEMKKGQVC